MRNLRNLNHRLLKHGPVTALASCAWDASSDEIICAFGPSPADSLIELRRWSWRNQGDTSGPQDSEYIASWDAPCPNPDLPCDRILNIHYFADSHATCLVLAGGDIVNVSSATAEQQQQIEIVGSVNAGIAAAAWSPDEELLVILTNADTFLYMTRDFDNVATADLSIDDLKSSKHVSVGWGKAETQFRGKGAKALKDPTVPEKVDKGLFSPNDSRESSISWRGDGAFVAVNSCLASSRRVIRVYSREGELDGVSEPVDYMESAVSWRPSGNLIAGVQRLQDRVDVIFFERNGLRHGQFSLRLSAAEMSSWAAKIDLQWNIDSSVLAVCFVDRVQLWTMGNYHYYLKREVRYSNNHPEGLFPFFTWHLEEPLAFAVGLGGSIQRYLFANRVASGTKIPPNDTGLVSVIDGSTLKLTPLRVSNVPPPMALTELSLPSNIVDISYADQPLEDGTTILIGVLDQEGVSVFQWGLEEMALAKPAFVARCEITSFIDAAKGDAELYCPRQVTFITDQRLLVLASDGSQSLISMLQLHDGILRAMWHVSNAHVTEIICESNELNCEPHLWVGTSLIPIRKLTAFEDNGCISVVGNNHDHANLSSERLPLRAESVAIALIQSASNVPGSCSRVVVFSLDRNGMLSNNGNCISRGCTSFLVTNSHLIFTTSQHLVKFVHLVDDDALDIPADTPEVDERCRSIERGAKLITVIPSTSALVLQMPRGNLETIYPRALVLPLIRACIDEGKYKKAFLACRNHRVDMNILHDHAPQKFLGNVDKFIDQLRKVEHIDLFLSQLREEDVSVTMYKDTMSGPKIQQINGGEAHDPGAGKVPTASKVNRICDAFVSSLSSKTAINPQNIITAHVCRNPPDLEAGLKEVAVIRRRNPENGERAVEHICFLADVNRLYDTALGLYDLDMTLQIAQQSQRDPREYLPFLQKLKEKQSIPMKVDIDNHLGRFKRVLAHLQELDDFEAFRTHMVWHSLYEQALVLYRYQEDRVCDITLLYADHLRRQSKHQDAAVAYEYLQNYEAASECYRLAHSWQESLSCATLVPLEQPKMRALAMSIADSQIELKDYRAAATIHLDYFHNVEEAARLFCRGYYIADATRAVSLHQRPELLQTVIGPGLAEGQAAMTELLAECKNQLNAQVPRIRELRVKKAQEPLAFYDADANGGADIPDNISLAATDASTAGGTLFTRYTNRTGTVGTNATRRTSKKRRQEERKRARGKKGSVYEEEYLVNSVARLIERVNSLGDEVARLVTGLMRRGMRERARAVESAMVTVVELCKQHAPEVFQNPDGLQAEQKNESETPDVPRTGGDAVLYDSIEEARMPKEAPVIKDFQRLSILGE